MKLAPVRVFSCKHPLTPGSKGVCLKESSLYYTVKRKKSALELSFNFLTFKDCTRLTIVTGSETGLVLSG